MSKDKKIEKFLNEISIVSENKNELYEILVPLILSKKFFKNSKEKREFVETVLEFEIANYAYSSKTILLGKIINNINCLEIQDAVVLNNKVSKFIIDVINANEILGKENTKSSNKKSQAKQSFFKNWNEYINNK
ncbi:hypothetical protein [Clostridium tertium]|uniref:hypothetical protein n=1 Tax=Clostridium tertium TaxID=1559 RepID=UPI00332F331F